MKKIAALALLCAGALTGRAAITGQWDFDNPADGLAATTGAAMTYYDFEGGATDLQTEFGTTTSFGIPDINGEPAGVMSFGVHNPFMGFSMNHGISANGGGFLVNQWTLIMDVMFPASSSGQWRALIQTDVSNPANDDAELYINESDGFGINGQYEGAVPADTWVRLAVAVDLSQPGQNIEKYINGTLVGTHAGELDMRFALTPDWMALLFTDGYADGVDTQPGYVNSIQIHDTKLPRAEIVALGGPSADGIPADGLARAFVSSVTPASGANVSPKITYEAVIENADTSADVESIVLRLNGTELDAEVTATATGATVSYTAAGLHPAGSTQTFELVFDDIDLEETVTNVTVLEIANYTDLPLPEPIVFEDFEGTDEGSLPSGWTELNFSELTNFDEDLGNLDSATYGRWTVVDSARFNEPLLTYSADLSSDYQRVHTYNPIYVVNGQVVEEIAQGKIAFANSGYRNGDVVEYLFTPDFDLTAEENVHLVFHSIFEQNQDSIGAVEYSIDQGATWLPILYMLAGEDIVQTEGTVDAEATFSQTHDDVATYVDPVTFEERGGFYGAFIGVESNQWSELGPFISARGDDVAIDSKRVEVFRLAEADNQATVRFRFAHAGTDSWYFGIDNFGLYSLDIIAPPEITTHPQGSTVVEGTTVALTVAATGTGPLTYAWYLDGEVIPGATGANLLIPDATLEDAGEYFVRVTNEGGSVDSETATVTVNARPAEVAGLWNFDTGLSAELGSGTLEYATVETEGLVSFQTTDGTTVPHIDGQPASYLAVGLLPAGAHGLLLEMPTAPNGGGEYLNEYTLVWDMLLPADVNWTPLFNTDYTAGNDADFYVADTGALGIGDLGYSADGVIAANTWYRVAFVANLDRGEVTYYLNGEQVHRRSGDPIVDERFAGYTGSHEGPDMLLLSEPSGDYNHAINVSSFLFVDRALSADEITALGGPSAGGIPWEGTTAGPELAVARDGGDVTLSWAGEGFTLQRATSLTNPDWQDVPVPAGTTTHTEAATGTAFFRLVGGL